MTDGVIFDIEFLDPERVSEILRSNEWRKPGVRAICRFTIYRQEICINATCSLDRFLLNALK